MSVNSIVTYEVNRSIVSVLVVCAFKLSTVNVITTTEVQDALCFCVAGGEVLDTYSAFWPIVHVPSLLLCESWQFDDPCVCFQPLLEHAPRFLQRCRSLYGKTPIPTLCLECLAQAIQRHDGQLAVRRDFLLPPCGSL
jgi:hypothetical protein